MSEIKSFTIAAVGDIAFCGHLTDHVEPAVFDEVKHLLQSADLTIGNLEGPLTSSSDSVPGKCSLRGNQQWAQVLKESGFDLVTLANNHTMDYGCAGLFDTMSTLESAGIAAVGAGENRFAAAAPVTLNINGCRVAVLARTMVEVASPSYAEDKIPGVAYFDEEETCDAVKKCKANADFVILLIHWGLEEYSYPAPKQRDLAQRLIYFGADIILGHHPHVLQGMEQIGQSFVAYSLGNFLFGDIEWKMLNSDENASPSIYRINKKNRDGIILIYKLEFKMKTFSFENTHTKIEKNGKIHIENNEIDFLKYSNALNKKYYNFFWRLYSIAREWDLRIKPVVFPSGWTRKIYKIRLKHFSLVFKKIFKSINMMLGKTTNPYE